MKVFLAGHKGLVGSAILRKLVEKKYKNIITIDKKKLNLLNQEQVFKFIKKKKPNVVTGFATLMDSCTILGIKERSFNTNSF